MNARAPDDVTLARERLQRSRENLHRQIHGDAEPGGAAPLARALLTRGVQAIAGGAGGSGGLKVGIAVAAALFMLFARRRVKAGGLGLLLPLAFAALKFARRRQ